MLGNESALYVIDSILKSIQTASHGDNRFKTFVADLTIIDSTTSVPGASGFVQHGDCLMPYRELAVAARTSNLFETLFLCRDILIKNWLDATISC